MMLCHMMSLSRVSLVRSVLTTQLITHVSTDQDDTDPTTLCDDGHQNWLDCSFCGQLRLSLSVTSHPDKYLLSNFHLQTPLIDIPHQITSASYWTESHQNYIINMAPTSGLRTEKYLSQLWSYSTLSVVSFLMICSIYSVGQISSLKAQIKFLSLPCYLRPVWSCKCDFITRLLLVKLIKIYFSCKF